MEVGRTRQYRTVAWRDRQCKKGGRDSWVKREGKRKGEEKEYEIDSIVIDWLTKLEVASLSISSFLPFLLLSLFSQPPQPADPFASRRVIS